MFEASPKEIEFDGVKYPYKCSNLVLEKIQQKTGDLAKAHDLIAGFRPKKDADGVEDRTEGTYTFPDISLVCESLAWMIEEGIEISGSELTAPTALEIKRQDEYSLKELAVIVFTDFNECIAGKKTKKKKTRTAK